MRRILLFATALVLGLAAGNIVRGEWPEISWRGMTWVEPEKPELPVEEEVLKLAGLTPVTGPGIRITVTDATRRRNRPLKTERLIVHERDLLMIRNELFAAGAEAMSINGNRIVAVTEIRCIGPAISINGRNTVPPYVVDATGDPEVLKQSILMMGGVVDLLAEEKLKVQVDKIETLDIPAYDGGAKMHIEVKKEKKAKEETEKKKKAAATANKKKPETEKNTASPKKKKILKKTVKVKVEVKPERKEETVVGAEVGAKVETDKDAKEKDKKKANEINKEPAQKKEAVEKQAEKKEKKENGPEVMNTETPDD